MYVCSYVCNVCTHLCRTLECTKESLLVLKEQLAAREEAERKAKVGGDDFGGFGGFGGGGTQPPDGEKKEGAEPLGEGEGREVPAGKGQEGGEGEEEAETPASAEGSLSFLEEDGAQHISSAERQLTEEMNIRCVCTYMSMCGMWNVYVCTYVRMCVRTLCLCALCMYTRILCM